MIKFMILFRQPEDAESFENIYQDFLGLIERMPQIQRRQVVHITGSPQGTSDFYRILEIYFESLDQQNEALMSAVGQEAGAELSRLPEGSFQLLFADVYEEAGASTPVLWNPKTIRSQRRTKSFPTPFPLKRRLKAAPSSRRQTRSCRRGPGAALCAQTKPSACKV